jgi:hypothetical protein
LTTSVEDGLRDIVIDWRRTRHRSNRETTMAVWNTEVSYDK